MRLLVAIYDTLRFIYLLYKASKQERELLFVRRTQHGYVLTHRPLSTNIIFGKQGARVPTTRTAVEFIHFWADYYKRDYLMEKEYTLRHLRLHKDNYDLNNELNII